MKIRWSETHLATINVAYNGGDTTGFTDCDEIELDRGIVTFLERGDTPDDDVYHVVAADVVSIARGPRRVSR